MRKLILFFAALFVVSSCSMEDNTPQFHVEFVPIESVEMPESFTIGNSYDIKVWYKRPSDCHFFEGFYYEEDGTTLTVAAQTLVIEDATCESLENEPAESAVFTFVCSPTYDNTTSYHFKFFTGDQGGQLGQDSYLEFEVPVLQ